MLVVDDDGLRYCTEDDDLLPEEGLLTVDEAVEAFPPDSLEVTLLAVRLPTLMPPRLVPLPVDLTDVVGLAESSLPVSVLVRWPAPMFVV